MDKRVSGAVPSINELKKMIKKENLDSGRLTSLRLPRDLSLGGTKPKKVYTPNLNVVRNKDKSKHVSVRGERGQKRSAEHLGLNRSRHNDKRMKYIQSESVFSQGMGELKVNSFNSNRSGGEYNANNAIPIPKLNKNCWNVSRSQDNELMNELVANGDSDSDSENEYDPVVLPLELNKGKFSHLFKLKSEDFFNERVKKENMDHETESKSPVCNGYDVKSDIKPEIKSEASDWKSEQYSSFTDCTNTYDEDNPAFSILQLPTSFLGKIWKDDPNDKDLDYTLWDMPEGQLGKIVIRKSGKMEMIVKNTKYVLNGGSTGSVLESLMLFPGEQSIASVPSMVTLGKVSEKFTVTPEWVDLFDRARKNKKFFW